MRIVKIHFPANATPYSAFATGAVTRIHDLRNVVHRARRTTRPLVDHQPIHDVKEPNGNMQRTDPMHIAKIFLSSDGGVGGAGRDRTDDLKLAKLALSQLSYGPMVPPALVQSAIGITPREWWA